MDGKLFLLDKATPPPMSQVAATTFTFDLQRFTDVDTLDALKTALESGGEIKLTADITGDTNTLNISKDTTLDLNGHTLTTGAQIGVQVNNGVTFNLEDSTATAENGIGNGEIKSTFTSTDSEKSVLRDQDKAAVVMVGENVGSTNNATFTMNSGKITSVLTSDNATDGSGKLIGVDVIGESTFNLSGGSVKSSKSLAVYFGTIGSNGNGKFVSSKGQGGGGTFNMTGGTLESNASEDLSTIQVSGNHVKSTTINISGGEVIYKRALKDNDTDSRGAIFSSGVSNITISDSAKITSTHVGIEMRAGTLNVTGGTIESTSNEPIEYNTNTNAAFRQGVAIAVAQSSTAKNININIEGGTVKGYSALTVANPKSLSASDNTITTIDSSSNHNGEPESGTDYRSDTTTYKIGTVSVNVKGGTLTSNGTGNDSFSQINSDDPSKGYTLSGKHAIANLDERVTINISNTEVYGGIVALTTGRTGTGYNIGTGNAFGSLSENAGQNVLLTYNEFGTSDNFKVSKLGASGSFNRPDKDAKEWIYLAGNGSSATTVASIGSAAEDSNTLMLTVPGGTASLSSAAEIDFTSNLFSKYNNATKFDGSAAPASFPLNIKGNDKITEIKGGAGNDSIKPGEVDSVTVTLTGGEGADLFFFDGNSNTITDFGTGDDSVTLANSKFRPANADFLATTDKITIDFGGGDALMFEGLGTNEVSLPGGHIFATRYHAFDKQITFTSVKDDAFDATSEAKFANYATIDAASASAISIMGNSQDNRIIGSNKGGSLNGGAGNDRLIVTDRNSDAKYLFEHKAAGKDSIEGFDDTRDTLAITPADITEAKGSGSKLTLTFGKDNSVVLKSDVDIEKVSLSATSSDYLTSSGYRETDTFKLFANAKGKIDLTDTPYKDTGIKTIDATKATKQSVTLTADSNVTTVKLAEKNKKKDLFVYGGGSVSISGYEAGTDRLNIADVGAVSLFTVDGDNGVSINAGGTNTISLQGALKNQEILIRDGGKSNSYQKFVFHANGVLYNKGKKPTEANIYSNVDTNTTVTAADSIKKIFLQAGVSGASIASGNNKATLDASEANGVTLIGGAKNNKFIASAGDDLFVYKGGKDNIQDFDAKDKITLDGDFSLSSAKISASGKSLKFKFTNKNALTLKSDGKITSASINGGDYSFSKNAVGLNGVVSLTSQFSGSYNLAKSTAIGNTVDGSAVKKNLTFKGTNAAESLVGGQKKTTFKGGGGDDIFYGGTGKDVFFYAKTDSGDKTIQNFGFGSNNDKIKIASGTIKTISKSGDNITFSTNGGSLTVKDADNVLIKANNTYYWFAESADSEHSVSVGDLITADTKVSNAQAVATDYDVIDLGYSTNLVKTNLATKAGSFTFNGGITKNNTTT